MKKTKFTEEQITFGVGQAETGTRVNEFRPHSALGDMTPRQFRTHHLNSQKSVAIRRPGFGTGSNLSENSTFVWYYFRGRLPRTP
jgi:hypothetical protein